MKLNEMWKKGSGVPTTGDIPVGGLAVDVNLGKVFSKKDTGEIFEIGKFQFNDADVSALQLDVETNKTQIDLLWNTPSIRADQTIAAEIKTIYLAYLGREPDTTATEYWVQEINLSNIAYNDLEQSIYIAADENGETLLKVYKSPEQIATETADLATISGASTDLVSQIKSWYSIILHNYEPDNAGIAYWIREIDKGTVLIADLDEAIFNAAFDTKPCYNIPDTLVTQYELGTDGIAQVKTTATADDLVIPVTYMGEVSIDANGDVVVASDDDNSQAFIDDITANPTRAYNIVTYYVKYFGRQPLLDGVDYWLNDGTADADLERAIFVAGSMNGEQSTGTAYIGSQYAQMIADLNTAITNLQDAQASGDQTAINNATSTVNTAQTTVNNYSTATQASIASNPTRADAISDMYTTYLGREPDDAGLNYWINDSLSLDEIQAIISQGEQ